MTRTVILVIALAGALVGSVDGAELTIGKTPLQLGMPQAQVLAALSTEFDPKQVSVAEGKYILWGRSTIASASSAGSVSFKDGKLYRASKAWGQTPTRLGAMNALDGLFAALSEIAGAAGRVGRVKTQTIRTPGLAGAAGTEVRLVTVEMPPDRVVLLQTTMPLPGQAEFGASTTVDEYLVELPASQ